MLVDVYQSGINARQFVAIPMGYSLEVARIPDTPDFADLQLVLQGTDLSSGDELAGVNGRAVQEQVATGGFALFQGELR